MPVTGPRYVNPPDPLDGRTYGAHNLVRPEPLHPALVDRQLALRRTMAIALGLAEMVESLAKHGKAAAVAERAGRMRRDIEGMMAMLARDAA